MHYGKSPLEFWDLTIAELIDIVTINQRKEHEEKKFMLSNIYTLGFLVRKAIGSSLSNEEKFPSIEELYPGVFDEELEVNNKKIEEQQAKLHMEQMKAFAKHHNRKRGDG